MAENSVTAPSRTSNDPWPVRRESIHLARSVSRNRQSLRLPSPMGYEGKYPSRAQRVTVRLLRPPRNSAASSGVRNLRLQLSSWAAETDLFAPAMGAGKIFRFNLYTSFYLLDCDEGIVAWGRLLGHWRQFPQWRYILVRSSPERSRWSRWWRCTRREEASDPSRPISSHQGPAQPIAFVRLPGRLMSHRSGTSMGRSEAQRIRRR